jgi:hypothetical protein
MEMFAVVVVTILFTLGSLATGYCVWQVLQMKKNVEAYMANLEKMMGFVTKGHQLATILDIKPAVLGLSPDQLEPNKQELIAKIELQIDTCKHEKATTWAFVVVHYSGLEAFLDHETQTNLQATIARLYANSDIPGVKALLQDIVEQLTAPKLTFQ